MNYKVEMGGKAWKRPVWLLMHDKFKPDALCAPALVAAMGSAHWNAREVIDGKCLAPPPPSHTGAPACASAVEGHASSAVGAVPVVASPPPTDAAAAAAGDCMLSREDEAAMGVAAVAPPKSKKQLKREAKQGKKAAAKAAKTASGAPTTATAGNDIVPAVDGDVA